MSTVTAESNIATTRHAVLMATAEFKAIHAALDGAHVPRGDIDGLFSASQRVEWLARNYRQFLRK